MSGMDETLRAFLVESTENLAHLEEDLVLLERVPQDSATLARALSRGSHDKRNLRFFWV